MSTPKERMDRFDEETNRLLKEELRFHRVLWGMILMAAIGIIIIGVNGDLMGYKAKAQTKANYINERSLPLYQQITESEWRVSEINYQGKLYHKHNLVEITRWKHDCSKECFETTDECRINKERRSVICSDTTCLHSQTEELFDTKKMVRVTGQALELWDKHTEFMTKLKERRK